MTHVLKLFWKIFIRQFYIINAGFFLLFFILMFGIIHPPEILLIHESIIKGIIHSNVFTWIILLLWMMYNLKCILFCLRIFQREDNTFVYNLQALSFLKQCSVLLICHCNLYLPVMIYSVFVVYMAHEQGFKLYEEGLILFQVIMCVVGVYTYYYNVNFTGKKRYKPIIFLPELNMISAKMGLSSHLLYYTFQSRKIVFFVLKLTGIFLLSIMLDSDKQSFILRDFVLVFMMVVLFHSLLVYFYVEFIEKCMTFIRNLPLSRLHKWLAFLITYGLILCPELLFMIIHNHGLLTLQTIILFYGISIAELLLFTSILYFKSMRMKHYLQRVFGIFLLFSILMLSGNYQEIFLIMISLSLVLFYKHYYRYEVQL